MYTNFCNLRAEYILTSLVHHYSQEMMVGMHLWDGWINWLTDLSVMYNLLKSPALQTLCTNYESQVMRLDKYHGQSLQVDFTPSNYSAFTPQYIPFNQYSFTFSWRRAPLQPTTKKSTVWLGSYIAKHWIHMYNLLCQCLRVVSTFIVSIHLLCDRFLL